MTDFLPLGKICDEIADTLHSMHGRVIDDSNNVLPEEVQITSALIVFGVVGEVLQHATIRVPNNINDKALAAVLMDMSEGIERDGLEPKWEEC